MDTRRYFRATELFMTAILAVTLDVMGLPFSDDTGPQSLAFVVEPNNRVEFTNDTGAVVACSARGQPTPRVTWTQQDGQPLREVTGVRRYTRADGTLYFQPFPGDEFRQGVHDAAYRCTASNLAGTIVSREVHVKAVVQRRFKVEVYDEFVVRGNTAVFRCQAPAFVREYVTFAWKAGDGSPIVPATPASGGRYSVLRSGELYIRDVTQTDGQRHYGCETRHRLTGKVVSSASSASLFVTEPHGTSSPKIVDYRPMMSASEGDTVELACAATAFPPPTYRWYREADGRLLPLSNGHRTMVLDGSLFLQFVSVQDSGRYVCSVNNTVGEDRTFTVLTVTAPLVVYVNPQRQVVDVGRSASFNCTVSGHPLRSIRWLKDGLPLEHNTRDTLHISSVQREDSGMYQCFAFNDFESAQGTAELRLGDVAPVLLSTFSGESVRPGTSVSLRCTASGNPLPQVTWLLDDAPIPDSTRFRIGDFVTTDGHVVSYVNVSEVRTGDGGEYSCAASNSVATRRHSGRLEVFGPPFVRKMQDMTAVAGRTVTLRCPVSGYPIQDIVWKKDGTTLPVNHRQRLEGLGRLIIQDVQRTTDEGHYSCEAIGPENRRAEGTMRMNVLVPPIIESALLPESLFAEDGKRTKIMCSVTQGDPPVQITWQRDGRPLPLEKDLSLQSFEDSSLLIFRKTSARHSGNYTCFASNAADTVNRTTKLVVNVPPRWSIEPTNSFAVVGQSVVMDCVADGYPTPNILWKKAAGSQVVDFREVMSSYRRQVFDNGSLFLQEVSESDAGHYLCQATNGIGAGLSKVVNLKIHTPPRFETKFVSFTVSRNKDAELRCEASGEPEIRIQWEKDKQPLDPETLKRLSAVEKSGPHSTTSRLLIKGAGRSDSALYTCIASNKFGRDETNMQLVVQEPPSPPVDLSVLERGSRTVVLNWSPTFSGNSPVLQYVIQYKNASDGDDALSSVTVPGTEVSGVVRGLVPSTQYNFRVLAENTLGQSDPGQFITVTTDEEVPGGPPLDVEVQPTGSQSLKVTWKPPREDLRHGPISGYYIGYRPSDTDEPFQYKNVEAQAQGLSYLTNLRRLTRYAIIVQAYNRIGAGPRSDEVLATTLEAAPPTSPLLTLHSTTSSSLTVTWDRQQDDTGIRDYILHYKADGGDQGWREQRVSTSGSRYTLERLRCGTGYRLYMTATNSLGTGEPGEVLAARTQGAAPLSPQREVFVRVNSTYATLHFGAWSSGGCPILYYSVHRRHKGQWEAVAERVDALQPQMDVRHLVPNREYTIRVAAHSEAGTTEAEYRFTTLNLTIPVSAPKGVYPSGDGLSSLPFHRNLAILLPVVISVAVLLVVVITVIVCLRRQMDTGSTSEDSRKGMEHMGLNEFPRKGSKEPDPSYVGPKSSYYSSPARKSLNITQHRDSLEGGNHEYAEPYSAVPTPRCLLDDSPSLSVLDRVNMLHPQATS